MKPLALVLAVSCASCSSRVWSAAPAAPQAFVLAPQDERLDASLSREPAAQEASHHRIAPLDAEGLHERIRQFVPVKMGTSLDQLGASEQNALQAIIAAARSMQEIYERQTFAGDPELVRRLATDTSELGKLQLHYWRIMHGPWDRLGHA